MKDTLRLTDISTAEGQMVSIDLKDIPDVEGLDLVKMPWRPVTDEQKAKVACILDEVCVLNIPKPQTPQEEEELVNRFLDGMRKLFSKENNWTFLPMLETSMDYCAQCNSCSDACHLYEMSGKNEMYRPNYRSEIFRRIYKQYGQMALRRHGPELEDRCPPGRTGLPLQPLPSLRPDLPHRCG